MRFIRISSAALLSLLLALVFDGVFLLACPALAAASRGCSKCPRPKAPHCPLSGGEQICPLLGSDRLAGEAVAAVAVGAAPVTGVLTPFATGAVVLVADADDWHHAAGLYIRIRVLRI
jgi:hypothetical protein